jgi:rod shape determining protein RodA
MLGRIVSTRGIDWTVFSLYIGLVIIGALMILAATYQEYQDVGFFASTAGKQVIWIIISFTTLGLILAIDWKFWQTFAYLIYGVSLVLLLGVLFLGVTIKGATSWYAFGGFSIQPSEFAKFGTCLALSSYISTYSTNLKSTQAQLIALGIILLPPLFILLQPDAGSALVFLSFFIVLYREGLSPNYYVAGSFLTAMLLLGLIYNPQIISLLLLLGGLGVLAYQYYPNRFLMYGVIVFSVAALVGYYFGYSWYILAAASFIYLLWAVIYSSLKGLRNIGLSTMAIIIGISVTFAARYAFDNVLKPHQKDRINVWLKPEDCDPRGSLYNLIQSKTAIAAGGLTGKGYLQGNMTKLSYVPEQSTDFIFCTIGEEQGFVGSFGMIAIFLMLLIRLTIIAERQRSNFSRVYAYCFVGILFIHFFINIGMTMGLMPIIGIPLPFISKGGSSLFGFSIMMGVLLKMDSKRYNI